MSLLNKLKILKQALLFIKEGAYERQQAKSVQQTSKKSDSRIYISSSASVESSIEINIDEPSVHSNSSVTIGNHVWLAKNVEINVWRNTKVEIKDYSTIQENCKIYGDVTIEKYCVFSLNCFLSSGNHYATAKPTWLIRDQDELVLNSEEGFKNHSKPIHIEEDCWIGWGVFIKQGITVGRGAVIGAYSVVTKDILPYTINAGQPAKKVKLRFDFCPPSEINALNDDHLPYFYRGFLHKKFEIDEARKEQIIYAGNIVCVILKKTSLDSRLKIVGKVLQPIKEKNDLKVEINLFESFVFDIKNTTFEIEIQLKKSIITSLDVPNFLVDFHYVQISSISNLDLKWGINKVAII